MKRRRPLSPEQKVRGLARLSNQKKALDVVVLDVREVCNFTDFFIIATAQSPTHLKALVDSLREESKQRDIALLGVDGYGSTNWVVMDFGEIIFHLFVPEARQFYQLERLWADAPLFSWQLKRSPAAASRAAKQSRG